ncbi:phenol hydroxylase subunit P4 [Amycolatopsis sp. FDAARGOS 1241]|uniref:phenol hydroxylase subunit P4 n=1 Tax=Amycolatopsis sp. FDAARGOS 1241 TaxID=2778070 RepID=UPI00194F96D3|nr:phenol hydroxylase subunit P4 [Amycolatopsis sp. FDAARGOS 1241]QRP48516.1 phenol hydroxylase [Amycolatopsis sp. FDAARGOS 1241]
MAVKARYDYDFPSADRAELFGDDQLVYVHWEGNPLFCSAACFRVPKAMPFAEFVENMVGPWAGSDPDFDPAAVGDWRVNDQPLAASGDTPLTELGIGHKAMLKFTA